MQTVVMHKVLGDAPAQVALADWDQPIQALVLHYGVNLTGDPARISTSRKRRRQKPAQRDPALRCCGAAGVEEGCRMPASTTRSSIA
jgi:hypothetical protein